MTGSVLALPLLAGTSAHAADGATWDRLADCESGGAWSTNQGNGFYGGLQLTKDLWEGHGGLAYADRPDLASRAQQIAVAERVLDALGPDAWPACSSVADLTRDGVDPDVDPGVPDTGHTPGGTTGPSPSHTGTPSGHDRPAPHPSDSGSPSGTPSGSPGESGSPSPSDSASPEPSGGASDGESGDPGTPGESADPSGDASGDSGTDQGNSPGDSGADDGSSSGDPAGSRPGTGDPSRDSSGRHRGEPAPDGDAGDRPGGNTGRHSRPGDSPAGHEGSYTVRPGDSLWGIADAHDVKGGWPALYALNKQTVGLDPDLILPGQSLDLVPESGVKQGQ